MYFHKLVLKYAYTLDVLIHQFVHMEFSDGTFRLLKNNFFNELDLTSFKFSAIKWFFKSLEESAKCHQKRNSHFYVFRKLDKSSLDYMQSAALIPPDSTLASNAVLIRHTRELTYVVQRDVTQFKRKCLRRHRVGLSNHVTVKVSLHQRFRCIVNYVQHGIPQIFKIKFKIQETDMLFVNN